MKRYKILFIPVLFLLLSGLVFSQDSNPPSLSKPALTKHVNFLASDSLQGRGYSGKIPALQIAADYLATNIAEMGLQFSEENYSQYFNLTVSGRDEKNSFFKILSKRKEKNIRLNQFVVLNQKARIVEVAGELVFAEFGLPDETAGYNNINGLDLENKVVMISSGTPDSFTDGSSRYWNNSLERKKNRSDFRSRSQYRYFNHQHRRHGKQDF